METWKSYFESNENFRRYENFKTLRICSSDIHKFNENDPSCIEGRKKRYHEVLVFNPCQIFYKFELDVKKPSIILNNRNIKKLTTLIVRRVRGGKKNSALLVYFLISCGFYIVDPIDRFKSYSPTEMGYCSESKHQIGTSFSPLALRVTFSSIRRTT